MCTRPNKHSLRKVNENKQRAKLTASCINIFRFIRFAHFFFIVGKFHHCIAETIFGDGGKHSDDGIFASDETKIPSNNSHRACEIEKCNTKCARFIHLVMKERWILCAYFLITWSTYGHHVVIRLHWNFCNELVFVPFAETSLRSHFIGTNMNHIMCHRQKLVRRKIVSFSPVTKTMELAQLKHGKMGQDSRRKTEQTFLSLTFNNSTTILVMKENIKQKPHFVANKWQTTKNKH